MNIFWLINLTKVTDLIISQIGHFIKLVSGMVNKRPFNLIKLASALVNKGTYYIQSIGLIK
jgi:hypothetical protein